MANIKKSFNFRNGVQVDEDNLLVTPTGLVAIGKTIPTEALDVIGNVVISGVTSSVFSQTGILTVTTLEPTEIIGAGVSVVSGVVTSNSGSGIVTYYGDARFLQGMPTSQWEDTDVGFGVSSIYNTGGTVGIATTNPQSTLQIGNDPDAGEIGVGIASAGHIKASGIITATGFVGNLTGNVTGNIDNGTVVSGIATFSGDIDANGGLDVDGHSDLDSLNVSGIGSVGIGTTIPASKLQVDGDSLTLINKENASNTLITVENTATGNAGVRMKNSNAEFTFLATSSLRIMDENAPGGGTERFTISSSGDVGINSTAPTAKLDVNGSAELDNVNISGICTLGVSTVSAGSDFHFGNSAFFKDEKFIFMGDDNVFRIGHHAGPGHSQIKHDSAAQDLVLAADRIRVINRAENKGLASFTEGGQVVLNYDGDEKLKTSGIGVTIYNQLDTTNIIASSTITAAEQLNTPICGIGTDAPANDIQVRKVGNAEIQVTSDTGSAGITLGREPDTNNTNNAEFRYGSASGGAPYSSAQSLDIINYGTDNFNYHLSANNPGAVVGDFHWHKGLNSGRLMTLTNTGRLGIGETQPNETLHVAGVSSVTGNSFVGGNFSVSGNSTVGGNLTVDGSLNISSINTDITGNVTGNLTGNVNSTSGISTFFNVGINTTLPLPTANLDVSNGNAVFKNVGIGSTDPDGILDVSGALSQASKKFILLPKVSAAGTSVLQSDSVEGGALIYNTTLRKLQFYNGNNWETVTSVEVFG